MYGFAPGLVLKPRSKGNPEMAYCRFKLLDLFIDMTVSYLFYTFRFPMEEMPDGSLSTQKVSGIS